MLQPATLDLTFYKCLLSIYLPLILFSWNFPFQIVQLLKNEAK